MNGTLRKSLVAIALLAAFGTAAYAQENGESGNGDKVTFNKKVKLHSDISISGDVRVRGTIPVESAAIAIINNTQTNSDNVGENGLLSNDAAATDGTAGNASGNIGVNIAAGDNNQQDNAAALSAADASFTFGLADAEVFVNQSDTANGTLNLGTANSASIADDAFSNASGNIGANVTAGNNNQQKNAMAASVATSSFAQATVSSSQTSSGNTTMNAPFVDVTVNTLDISLGGSASGSYSGSGQGSADLGLSGAMDQIGDVYPDTWSGNAQPSGSQTGHFDLDSQVGGSDLNDDGGALAFGYTDGSSASGGLGFEESGDVALDSISLSGTVAYLQTVYQPTTNSATLSGNAFNGASGNIGINVAAGTGNQQANSLAMAVAQPTTGGGGGGGGGGGE